jgi:NADH:ubiquinone oxidoreductase subunit 4 (subunit M)
LFFGLLINTIYNFWFFNKVFFGSLKKNHLTMEKKFFFMTLFII